MNNIFCADRMWRYLKLYLTLEKKTLLKYAAAIFAVLLFLLAVIPYLKYKPVQELRISYGFDSMVHIDWYWQNCRQSFWLVLFVVLLNRGGMFFSNLAKKGSRIETLMVPASNLEKFCTYFLVNVVGFILLFFVEFYLADAVRVVISSFYLPADWKNAIVPIGYLLDLNSTSWHRAFLFGAITGLAAVQGYFTLASSVWPKRGILGGTVSFLTICFVLLILMFTGFATFVHSAMEPRQWLMSVKDISAETLLYCAGCFNIVMALFFYSLSYLRFTEIETIDRW